MIPPIEANILALEQEPDDEDKNQRSCPMGLLCHL